MPFENKQVARDVAIGMKGENYCLPIFRHNYNPTIQNTKEKCRGIYCGWDFEDEEENRWEVKTRPDLTINSYRTMYISAHKMAHQKEGKKLYMCFNLRDGVWVCEYDKDLFSTFIISDNEDRRHYPPKWEKVVNIPTKYLTRLEDAPQN